MSNLNWKICQNFEPGQAATFKAMMEGRGIWGVNIVEMARQLTQICDNMSGTYEEALADENLYEIQEGQRSVEEIKQELIEKQTEINKLQQKQKDGTITKEEEDRLKTLSDEVGFLSTELSDAIAAETSAIHGLNKEVNEQKSVRETALDYSEKTIDTGESVIRKFMRKAHSFFSRLFGRSFRKELNIGEGAVLSGVKLETVVKTSDAKIEVAKAASEAAAATVKEAEKAAGENTSIVVDDDGQTAPADAPEDAPKVDPEKKPEE